MADLQALTSAIEVGDRATALRVTGEAIDEGVPAQAVLDAMGGGMAEVGRRAVQRNEIFVPEMLIAARAMKEAPALLEPLLVDPVRPEHRVIGTVKGDLHDIGKNLVAMMWQGANFEVIDLGVNVTPERFVEAAEPHEPSRRHLRAADHDDGRDARGRRGRPGGAPASRSSSAGPPSRPSSRPRWGPTASPRMPRPLSISSRA